MRRGDSFKGRARRGDARRRFVPQEWRWSHRTLFRHGKPVAFIVDDPDDRMYLFVAVYGDHRSEPMTWGAAVAACERMAGRTRTGSAAA
jgi:hypothetical protein